MRLLVALYLIFICQPSEAALSAASCKSKIRAAHLARTGQALNDSSNNVIIDICQGIVDEIQANAKVQMGIVITIPSTASPGNPSTGTTTSLGVIQ
ncbi:hypothetical protein [Bdellovibrio bacteriovorus]|uniref:hypothetical protein n=1 Tax=Bdellovibrio bacteriovorus TaxID=959 RepID=UPI003AA7C54A